jgi:hypothetical protein
MYDSAGNYLRYNAGISTSNPACDCSGYSIKQNGYPDSGLKTNVYSGYKDKCRGDWRYKILTSTVPYIIGSDGYTETECRQAQQIYDIAPGISWGTAPLPVQQRFTNGACAKKMCLYWALKYSIVPCVTWGTMPGNLMSSWDAASMDCNNVLAQGFKIKHPKNGLYISSTSAGDVIEGAPATRSVLSSTPELFVLAQSTSVAGFIGFKNKSTSNLFRFSANYYYEDVLTASMKEVTGGVSFRITGAGGEIVGYDATSNRLMTTQVGQAMDVAWQFSNYLS